MQTGESRKHHFVPKFLMKPWLTADKMGQMKLTGFWWDTVHGVLRTKDRGLKSFCVQTDLLSLGAHNLGRDAIERIFFGSVDSDGAVARDDLLSIGPARISNERRCDFARLLLSLDARWPKNVERIKTGGAEFLRTGMNSDPEIRAAMGDQGISDLPSSYFEQLTGTSFEDRALTIIQQLVNNPVVGKRLINAHWGLKKLDKNSGYLVLADRPFIRIKGYDDPGAVWILPLTPKIAFFATNHVENSRRLQRASSNQFMRLVNVLSARQAQCFIFSVDHTDEKWLARYLRPSP